MEPSVERRRIVVLTAAHVNKMLVACDGHRCEPGGSRTFGRRGSRRGLLGPPRRLPVRPARSQPASGQVVAADQAGVVGQELVSGDEQHEKVTLGGDGGQERSSKNEGVAHPAARAASRVVVVW